MQIKQEKNMENLLKFLINRSVQGIDSILVLVLMPLGIFLCFISGSIYVLTTIVLLWCGHLSDYGLTNIKDFPKMAYRVYKEFHDFVKVFP